MRILLLSISFLFASSLLAQDYYWVGGSGNWSDLSHWATSSGGTEFHTEIPDETNNVYLDSNSFSSSGQVITLDVADCNCLDFNTTGVQFFPLVRALSSGEALRPFGNIYLDPGLQRDFRQFIMSKESGVQELVTSGISLGNNCFLGMDGGADYHLMDSVSVRGCGNSSGRLFTNGNPVNCSYNFSSNYGAYREMHLSTSNIYCYTVQFNSGMLMDADEASFYISGEGGVNNSFWGAGFTYGKLELGGEISLTGNNTYSEFIVKPGAEITLAAGSVQTAGQFEFNGTNEMPISLQSSVTGDQASVSQVSGSVNGNFMVLRDSDASGGAEFNADNSVDLGNNTGWNIIENLPATYYWVNGEGEWSDLNHWAATSGGTDYFTTIPTAQDTVIFDAMSFAGAGTLDINIEANCADWRMENVNSGMIIDAHETVHVYGHLTLAPGIEVNFSIVSFEGGEGPYQITSNGNYWGPLSILKFGVGGEYELADDFEGQAIQQNDGIFRSMGNTITLDWELKTEGVGSPFLDIANSTVNCNYWRPYADDQFAYALQNSFINCGNQFYGNGLNYPEVQLFGIQTTIQADASFNSLVALPGSTLIFESGNTYDMGSASFLGTMAQPITIRSSTPGSEAYFIGTGSDVLGDYLTITDNHASGSATFTATNSNFVSNVEGWSDGLNIAERSPIKALYPNPCSDVLTIEMTRGTNLDLYSVFGELVRSINSNGQVMIRLDVKDLASGIYILREQSTMNKGISIIVN